MKRRPCLVTNNIPHTIYSGGNLVVTGKVQNMDPLRGPGPSKYGQGPWTPYFY